MSITITTLLSRRLSLGLTGYHETEAEQPVHQVGFPALDQHPESHILVIYQNNNNNLYEI